MAKRAGQVGFGSGQSGHGSKRVIFKRVNRVTDQTGCGSNGSGQTGLTRFAMSTLKFSLPTNQSNPATLSFVSATHLQQLSSPTPPQPSSPYLPPHLHPPSLVQPLKPTDSFFDLTIHQLLLHGFSYHHHIGSTSTFINSPTNS